MKRFFDDAFPSNNSFKYSQLKSSKCQPEQFTFNYKTQHSEFISHNYFAGAQEINLNSKKKLETYVLKQFAQNTFKINKHDDECLALLDQLIQKETSYNQQKKKKKYKLQLSFNKPKISIQNKNEKMKIALMLSKQNYFKKEICAFCKIPRATFYKYSSKKALNLNQEQKQKGIKTKISLDKINFMKNLFSQQDNQYLSLNQIKQQLNIQFKEAVQIKSLSTISKIIKFAGYSYKKTNCYYLQQNSARQIQNRYELAKTITEILDQNYMIVYIDECSFSSQLKPLYSYSKIGKPIKQPILPKTKNLSMIAAISSEDLLGTQFFSGGVSSQDFACFILNLLKNIEKCYPIQKIVFFMDNASIHKAKIIKNLFLKIHILYNAAYSPFLNPIEECFSWIKNKTRIYQITYKGNSLRININKACEQLPSKIINKYYIHSLSQLKQCIQKQKFE